jgi:hypothetical protein
MSRHLRIEPDLFKTLTSVWYVEMCFFRFLVQNVGRVTLLLRRVLIFFHFHTNREISFGNLGTIIEL